MLESGMLTFVLLGLLAASPSQAQAWKRLFKTPAASRTASCPRVRPVIAGGTQGYADSLNSGLCFVSISPTDTTGLIYRNYGIFSDGMLLVFNSFGDSEDTAKDTGAREFYFFPRAQVPALSIDAGGPSVSVRMADGGLLSFDPATAQPNAAERGSVSVAPRLDRGNRGGLEFPSYSGLMLDVGFRMGELPSGRPSAESSFRDANGRLCAVKNSEVFAYANGERSFRFDDPGLKALLKTRCPSLSVYF